MAKEFEWNADRVSQLYRRDDKAQSFLNAVASRERNLRNNRTTVEQLEQDHDMDRHKAIEMLRELEHAHCGRFVVGRRGMPSRFEWTVPAIDVAKVAVETAEETKRRGISIGSEGKESLSHTIEQPFFDYPFFIRPGMAEVVFRLPRDLTQQEANRIADFIKSLPFRSDES